MNAGSSKECYAGNGQTTMMERTFDRRLLVGIALVVTVLVVNAGLGYRNTHQMYENAGRVAHTYEVLALTDSVLLTLLDAETGQRGFIAGRQEELLEPYHLALAKIDDQVAKLVDKTKDNERQQQNSEKLIRMTAVELDLLNQGIQFRRDHANESQITSGVAKGKVQMDAIRELVRGMRLEEQKLLSLRQDQSYTLYVLAQTTCLLAALLGLGMIGVFLWLLQGSLRARQKTTALLQEKTEWLRTTLNSIGDAVLTTDALGRVISLNPVAESLTGWTSALAAGQPLQSVFTIINENSRQPVENPALRALQEGKICGLANHTILIARDGTEKPLEDSAAPITDPQGKINGAVLIFRDVTERRRLERLQRDLHEALEHRVQEQTAELRSGEERFRLLIEGSKDMAIFMLDPQGVIVSWNAGAEHIKRYKSEEIIGQHFSLFFPPEAISQGKAERLLKTALTEGRCEEEGWRVRKDGSKFWASVIITPLYNADGQHQGFSKITRDLTERRRVQSNFDESRRFVERIAEMMPSILYVYDFKEERNMFSNHRVQSLLGYSAEETRHLGIPFFQDNLHSDDLATIERAHMQFLAAEDGAIIEFEFRLRHANGEWRWLHTWHTVFARDSEGSPSQLLGIAQDITERKRLEQEVVEIAATEQRRIGQELHDGTGQELTGLCMLADTLANTLREHAPTEAQLAHRIARGLQQALETVRALSRGLIPVEVDAEGLMVALSELTKRIRELHTVRCTFDCYETVPVEDNLTATQLYRIAQEAITNALKHSQASNIRVSLETRGNYITLRIADDGIGLPEAKQSSEGMGLRIMQYRAGQIGAHLVVRPGPTKGTVITCTLYRGTVND